MACLAGRRRGGGRRVGGRGGRRLHRPGHEGRRGSEPGSLLAGATRGPDRGPPRTGRGLDRNRDDRVGRLRAERGRRAGIAGGGVQPGDAHLAHDRAIASRCARRGRGRVDRRRDGRVGLELSRRPCGRSGLRPGDRQLAPSALRPARQAGGLRVGLDREGADRRRRLARGHARQARRCRPRPSNGLVAAAARAQPDHRPHALPRRRLGRARGLRDGFRLRKVPLLVFAHAPRL